MKPDHGSPSTVPHQEDRPRIPASNGHPAQLTADDPELNSGELELLRSYSQRLTMNYAAELPFSRAVS
jgi:hypothetical protein